MTNYVNDIYDIEKAFQSIEDELISSMMRNMQHHRGWEEAEGFRWSQWQVDQLSALEKYKKANQTKFQSRFSDINGKIDAIIKEFRLQGGMNQEITMLKAVKRGYRPKSITARILNLIEEFRNKSFPEVVDAILKRNKTITTSGEFFKLNTRKLDALIKATQDDFTKAEFAMLRQANDQYRQIIYNAQVYANSGAGTYAKAVDMATKDFLSRGIACIEYKNGARHTMKDYSSMCLRTASKRAYLTGEGEKRNEWGEHLVILNKRSCACPLCIPFTGKVLIDDVWSGGSRSDGKYQLMSEAMEAGLYHPRCKDSHTTYFAEISDINEKYSSKEMKQLVADYQQEQKKKYIQNQSEKYSRLAKHSIDTDNKRMYQAKADEWRQKENALVNFGEDGIINSGAISGARNPQGKAAVEHAKKYYGLVRSMKTDVAKIAKNTGYAEDEIQRIKNFIFMDRHDLGDGNIEYFEPDYMMGESWRRLIEGKPELHDLTLIEHEIMESNLMSNGYSQADAHIITSRTYNYDKEATEFYGKIKKYKKER